jgi:hypothetical protein
MPPAPKANPIWRWQPSEDKPWSTLDLFDLRRAIQQCESVELTVAVLGRAMKDVQQKAKELSLIENSDHCSERPAGVP